MKRLLIYARPVRLRRDLWPVIGSRRNSDYFRSERIKRMQRAFAVPVNPTKRPRDCKGPESEQYQSWRKSVQSVLSSLQQEPVAHIKSILEAGDVRAAVSSVSQLKSAKVQNWDGVIMLFAEAIGVSDKDFMQVLGVMRKAGAKLNTETWSRVLMARMKASSFENVLDILRHLGEQDPQGYFGACGMVLQAITKSRKHNIVCGEMLLEQMRSRGVQPDLDMYCCLIACCARRGGIAAAEKLWEELKERGLCPDTAQIQMIVKGYSDGGEFTRAEWLLNKMQSDGVPISTSVFNILIEASSGSKSVMRRFFHKMITAGVRPDEGTYDIIRKWIKGAGNSSPRKVNVTQEAPSAFAGYGEPFRWLMYACAKTGKMDIAEEVLRRMRGAGIAPDTPTFNVMIYGYAKSDDIANAERLLKRMCEFRVQPDDGTFVPLIAAFARRADISKLEWALEELVRRGLEVSPTTYSVVINALSKAGQVTKATAVLQQARKAGIKVPNVDGLLHAFAKRGEIHRAYSVYRDIREAGQTLNLVGYNVLIKLLAKSRKMSELQALYDEMREMQVTPDDITYRNMMIAYRRNGEHQKALEIRKELVQRYPESAFT